MKKALATYAVGPILPVHELLEPKLRSYAERHGYAYCSPGRPSDITLEHFDAGHYGLPQNPPALLHPSWAKLEICLELFRMGYDRVLWIDADVYVNLEDKDILEDIPEPTPDISFVIHDSNHVWWPTHPNCGIFLASNPYIIQAILSEAKQAPEHISIRIWEQAGLMRIWGDSLEWRFKTPRAPQPTRTPLPGYVLHELSNEWNYTAWDQQPAPKCIRFYHLCGMSVQKRLDWIHQNALGGVLSHDYA